MKGLSTIIFVAVACSLASANVQTGSTIATRRIAENKLVKQVAVVTAAAPKGKAVAAVAPGLFSKDVTDKLQLAALFFVWYAFNAGCKFTIFRSI